MKYKKGDKVRFLNAVGEGVVTKTTADGTVFVLDETGFENPAEQDELILISEYQEPEAANQETEAPAQASGTPDFYPEVSTIAGNEEAKAFFAMVPQPGRDATDADLETYLINDSNYILFYNLVEVTKAQSRGIDAGIVEPNTKVSLFTLLRQEIGKSGDYIFQVIFYNEGIYKPVPPLEKKIVISPIKLYKEQTFKENDFFHEKSLIFDLVAAEKPENEAPEMGTEEKKKLKELEKMMQSKKKADARPRNTVKKIEPEEKREIDLHINELIDNTTGLDNSEILAIQMDKFKSEMEQAIKDGIKRIVFIHGIGNGTLKNELRKTLTQQYSKYPFHDASFKEYGFGATLVVLKN